MRLLFCPTFCKSFSITSFFGCLNVYHQNHVESGGCEGETTMATPLSLASSNAACYPNLNSAYTVFDDKTYVSKFHLKHPISLPPFGIRTTATTISRIFDM